ncbi:hypothetical protein BHE74_00027658 [Ensete ventricosum]|nr:hypothetical protein BHE74_00027658 [Ensete ventricosum]
MGAEVVVMGELPLVPPIKTAPIRDKPAEDRRPEVTSTDDDDCVTPKSEEHVLKPVLVCPPAPRKPKPARRAPAAAPSREFRAVPRDLTSVFLSLPPKKRIPAKGVKRFQEGSRCSVLESRQKRWGLWAGAETAAVEQGRQPLLQEEQKKWVEEYQLALGKPSKQRLRSTNGRPLESSRVAEINGGEDLEMAQRGGNVEMRRGGVVMLRLLLWPLLLAPGMTAVWLNLPASGTKCVSEEIQPNVVVIHNYIVASDIALQTISLQLEHIFESFPELHGSSKYFSGGELFYAPKTS